MGDLLCQLLRICSVPVPEEPLEGGAGLEPGGWDGRFIPGNSPFSRHPSLEVSTAPRCLGMSGNGEIGIKTSKRGCGAGLCLVPDWHGSVLARLGPGTGAHPWQCPGTRLGVPAHGWVDLRSFNPNQSGVPWDRVQSLGKAPRPLPSLGLNFSPSWVKSWCSLLGFTRAGSGWTPAGISPWKGSSGPGREGWTPIPGGVPGAPGRVPRALGRGQAGIRHRLHSMLWEGFSSSGLLGFSGFSTCS